MSVGEKFGYFLVEDPNTTALPLPVQAADRLAVVRGVAPYEQTYYASALELSGVVPAIQTVVPASGDTVAMLAPSLLVNTGALAALTVRLPAGIGMAEICFAAPVEALTIQDDAGGAVSTAPTNGFGPGAAIQFRFIDLVTGWVYWK